MEQRTCNIIMCCKGHCKLSENKNSLKPLDAIAAYMSKECRCPKEDYQGSLLETIMEEALFDYMNGANRPGSDLRNLFHYYGSVEPTLCERIAGLFSLVQIWNTSANEYINGFTSTLIEQSKKDLGEL